MYSAGDTLAGGLPHSDIHVSTPARGSPWLFAACHVLHRLLVPSHPPNALLILDIPDTAPCGRASPCTETIPRVKGMVVWKYCVFRTQSTLFKWPLFPLLAQPVDRSIWQSRSQRRENLLS